MNIDKISTGRNPPHDINVIVEVSLLADPVKYEMDKESGAMVVDRFLHTAMHYPCNYGFVPQHPVRGRRSGGRAAARPPAGDSRRGGAGRPSACCAWKTRRDGTKSCCACRTRR
jgi:hypothetical protein